MRAVLLILSILLVAPSVSAQSGASIDQPVPYGTDAQVGAYMVRVVDVDTDATDEVMDWVGRRALKPSFGHVFVVVWIQATYVGGNVGAGEDLAYGSFVGGENVQLIGSECPGMPFDELNDERAEADIFPNGTVELGYCLELRPGEIRETILYFRNSVVNVFFSLDPFSEITLDGTPVATPIP